MVGGTLWAIIRWIAVLWILVHKILEDHALLAGLPKSTERKIPTTPAGFVTTIEAACLGGVPLVRWALIGAAVLIDNQSPRGTSVAIPSRTGTWLGTNDRL